MTEDFRQWVGRQQVTEEVLHPFPLRAMAATLDRGSNEFDEHSILPPLWHWLYFLDTSGQSNLARDGHPQRGGFLPPSHLDRRMWAGSRLSFAAPLQCGQATRRLSQIESVTPKQGKSGELLFVTISHQISQQGKLCIEELQDIVFRDNRSDGIASKINTIDLNPDFDCSIEPDSRLLFRYSALTFNAHRIHYDRDYAREQENYPGLLVHAPLLATLMLELLGNNADLAALREFSFRAMAPVFDQQPFRVCGQKPDSRGHCQLWVETPEQGMHFQGEAVLA
ncbi:MAG: acyl-CoA dehydrogenase [Pseudomonadales bacterium]|jgi:3-methylfumaryl-CoA hydratase|nr:acyl-CoA dehydrogenase [Pseudomonadales bacterium]